MPKNAGEFFQVVAFGIVPLVFIWVFGSAIWQTFLATEAPPKFTSAFVIVAGGSAGAVGAAVAVALGVKPTKDQNSSNNLNGTDNARMFVKQYGKGTFPNTPEKWQEVIGWGYLIAYFVLGGLATFIWVMKSGGNGNVHLVPELVETLAASFWGIALAVAAKRTS